MPFKRDLIIATYDAATNQKMLVQIPEATWRKAGKVTPQMAAQLDEVLNQGAVLAAVPELEEIGAACYLVNLASINVNPFGPSTGGTTKPAPGKPAAAKPPAKPSKSGK